MGARTLLDDRGIRGAWRKPRGRRVSGGAGGDRCAGQQPPVRLFTALALPLVADARLPGTGACRQPDSQGPRAGGCTLVHASGDPLGGHPLRTPIAFDLLPPDLDLARERGVAANPCVSSCWLGGPILGTV